MSGALPSEQFTAADMLGYGHAAYCAGWSAALRAVTGRPLSDWHGYDWLRDHPPTPRGEPLWQDRPPLAPPPTTHKEKQL